MITVFYILGYLAFLGFIFLAVTKLWTYKTASPLHARWELYPVPHEGYRASYGGSFMEDKEWWNKSRHISHIGDIIGMLSEILLLKATFEHNLKLWVRSYPFHLGMYMLMGGTIIVFISTIIQICCGISPSTIIMTIHDGGILTLINNLINAMVFMGAAGIIAGGLALIERRKNDIGLAKFTTAEHYLNLWAFVLFGVFTMIAWAFNPSFYVLATTFVYNLLTFNFASLSSLSFTISLLIGFALLIMIPITNMGHLIMKYHMYHDIRWGDEPTHYSEDNKKKIGEMLQFRPTWSAPHIDGNGSKTWVDVATTNPASEEK